MTFDNNKRTYPLETNGYKVTEGEEKINPIINEQERIISRLSEALQFYADSGNWYYLDIMYDQGEIARKALNIKPGGENE